MSDPQIMVGLVRSGTLSGGRHYGIAFLHPLNVVGTALDRELEQGGAAELGLRLYREVGSALAFVVRQTAEGWLHQAIFVLGNDASLSAVRAAVAGAVNRSGQASALDPLSVSVLEVNEQEFARRTGIGAPIFAAIDAAGRVAEQARRAANQAAQNFGELGDIFAKVAKWVPIAVGVLAGGVLLVVFWPDIRAVVKR